MSERAQQKHRNRLARVAGSRVYAATMMLFGFDGTEDQRRGPLHTSAWLEANAQARRAGKLERRRMYASLKGTTK